MKKKVLALLLTTAMVVTGLVGCGTKEEAAPAAEAATEEAAPAEEAASAEEAAPAETAENFKVGITIQSLENSYWAGVFGEVEVLLKERINCIK